MAAGGPVARSSGLINMAMTGVSGAAPGPSIHPTIVGTSIWYRSDAATVAGASPAHGGTSTGVSLPGALSGALRSVYSIGVVVGASVVPSPVW